MQKPDARNKRRSKRGGHERKNERMKSFKRKN